MRVVTPQIAFHQKEGKNDPILGVDVHPSLNVVATAGSDNEVKLWRLDLEKLVEGESPFSFLCGVQAHNASVNAVRFSPDGKKLASCSDDNGVAVFECKADKGWLELSEEKDLSKTQLRAHAQDVTDIAWSRDSLNLLSGSVDGKVLVWNAAKRTVYPGHSFDDHGHYVQGVAWDPYGHYFCSESADRSVKIYKACSLKATKKGGKRKRSVPDEEADTVHPCKASAFKFVLHADLSKRTYAVPVQVATAANPLEHTTENAPTNSPENNADTTSPQMKKMHRSLFLDDSVPTFFRRPTWSPDGSLLVCPTAFCKSSDGSKVPSTMVYVRGSFNSPALHLPGISKASIGVRFSPLLFKLRDEDGSTKKPWLNLPYRMVFAVATLDAVFIYDTQNIHPIAASEQLHLSQITDLAWTADGLGLIVSSNDGYCSVISISKEEIGLTLPEEELPLIVKTSNEFHPLLEIEAQTASAAAAATSTSNSIKPGIRRIAPVLVPITNVTSTASGSSTGSPQHEPSPAKRKIAPMLIQCDSAQAVSKPESDASPAESDASPPKKRAALTLVSPLT